MSINRLTLIAVFISALANPNMGHADDRQINIDEAHTRALLSAVKEAKHQRVPLEHVEINISDMPNGIIVTFNQQIYEKDGKIMVPLPGSASYDAFIYSNGSIKRYYLKVK